MPLLPHTPDPLHLLAFVRVEPLQLAASHTVLAPYCRQAPEPSHSPSVPQLVAPMSVHSSSGSMPADTAAQVPFDPMLIEPSHDSHVPVHAELQQ